MAIFCYKYSMSIKDVIGMTYPQLRIMDECLAGILKAEAGQSDTKASPAESNTLAMGSILSMLKEKTGRQSFTLEEMQNPERTVALHLMAQKDGQSAGGNTKT